MPHEEFDHEDPMVLEGIEVDGCDPSVTLDMAACFVEEYLRIGICPDELYAMFHDPEYGALYKALQLLGCEPIRDLIDELQVLALGGTTIDHPDATADEDIHEYMDAFEV